MRARIVAIVSNKNYSESNTREKLIIIDNNNNKIHDNIPTNTIHVYKQNIYTNMSVIQRKIRNNSLQLVLIFRNQ